LDCSIWRVDWVAEDYPAPDAFSVRLNPVVYFGRMPFSERTI
jgi:hypothetical protein